MISNSLFTNLLLEELLIDITPENINYMNTMFTSDVRSSITHQEITMDEAKMFNTAFEKAYKKYSFITGIKIERKNLELQ